MCLFKRDEQENTCVHEECKNYYLLNKQICMYSKQTQDSKLPKPSEEHNLLELLQKKIKKEADTKPIIESPMSSFYNQNFTLNPLLMAQKVQAQTKTELSANSAVFFPMISQQHNMQQLLPSQDMAGQMNISNMNLAQLINLRNQSNIVCPPKINETSLMVDKSQSMEGSVQDFQSKLLSLVLSQNKMLTELKEKNDLFQDTLSCLVGEVAELKKFVKQPTTEILPIPNNTNAIFPAPLIGNSTDSVNTDNLLTYLYGPNPDFQYQLVLKQELSLPLYRERNFKFTVMLIDKNSNVVENTNRIPLSIGIYTSENPPKYIDSNTSGNKILKGFIEKDLVHGKATFEKIQIKEVTSHFRNGWIFFVVYPKTNTTANMVTVDGNLKFINGQNIRPLVLEKVIVKAKKTKEKDNAADADDNEKEEAEQEKEETIVSNTSA